jgi:glycosyltransferase involved in cell wall biosynthesis
MEKNRLKILSICSWYPNDFNPTLGNFVKKHAEAVSRNNDVVCLAVFPSPIDKEIRLTKAVGESFSEIVVYYPKTQTKFRPWNLIKNFFAHRSAFKKGYQAAQTIIGKPNLIHLNISYPLGIWALYLKWTQKIPYVVTENATGLHVGSDHSYPKTILFLCKIILKNASILLPVSADLKSYMKKLSPNSNFALISNVVDETIFNYRENTTIIQKKSFIHISTCLDVHKNISGMLYSIDRIAKYRQDFDLKIVSDGDVEYAKVLVQKLGLQDIVTFYPTMSTEQIADMIRKSSALLLFSNYENFPCVIAETLLMGKPVISTNVNGIPEHVHAFNGLLVNKGDNHALEKAICTFLDDDIIFSPTEIHAYAFNHFSYHEVGKQFDEQYRVVLKSQNN